MVELNFWGLFGFCSVVCGLYDFDGFFGFLCLLLGVFCFLVEFIVVGLVVVLVVCVWVVTVCFGGLWFLIGGIFVVVCYVGWVLMLVAGWFGGFVLCLAFFYDLLQGFLFCCWLFVGCLWDGLWVYALYWVWLVCDFRGLLVVIGYVLIRYFR